MREATDERAVGPIRIRISSSHPLARAKYAQLLSAPDFALTEDGQFDVAVFDSNFMSLNAVLAQMRNTSPKTRAIVLAESVNQDVCVGWAERGFWGVVPYSDCERNLANAICQVSRGQMYLPATVAVRLMVADLARKRMQHASGFTERERQVVDLLMRGLAYKEIGAALRITERTVKFHSGNVFRKLQIHSRKELAHIVLGPIQA